jgi:hypothetical protein
MVRRRTSDFEPVILGIPVSGGYQEDISAW